MSDNLVGGAELEAPLTIEEAADFARRVLEGAAVVAAAGRPVPASLLLDAANLLADVLGIERGEGVIG